MWSQHGMMLRKSTWNDIPLLMDNFSFVYISLHVL